MLKLCVKPVRNLVKKYVKLRRFSPLSTKDLNYLTSQVIFMPSFYTPLAHTEAIFTQPKLALFKLLPVFLYPYSTPPINEAKLIYK
jgi:hypothetical protein